MGFENKGHITRNYKLVREVGGGRLVHAKGCPIASDYDIMGLEEIAEWKPDKMNTCPCCRKQVYIAQAANDYQEHYRKYWDIFRSVPENVLRRLFQNGNSPTGSRLNGELRDIKMQIINNRLYLRVDRERWYIDLTLFPIGEVHLYHNNYSIKRRNENDEDWAEPGYHEHELWAHRSDIRLDPDSLDQMTDAIRKIAIYDYNEARQVHKKKHVAKQKRMHTLSEIDAEYWGFDEDEPMLMKM